MAFSDRMKEARLAAGMTQEKLAKAIGVAKSTYTGYEKGNSEPNILIQTRIMEALGVDANFLFQDEVNKRKDTTASPWEMDNIIKKYRSLDERGKRAVMAVLDSEKKWCDDSANKPTLKKRPVIPFLKSGQSVSAGTGTYLGPETFETIHVLENNLTRRASFAVPVRGDSMEPIYHDGDIILVEKTLELRVGEIGVFTIDNSGYVKKLGNGELISLNPNYAPVPMQEDIRCNGRVIGVLEKDWIIEDEA